MSNPITLERIFTKGTLETRNFAMDFTDVLEPTETISTIDVEEQTTAALTVTLEAVNTTPIVVNRKKCETGKGVTFRISGGVAKVRYKLKATIVTSASQTITRFFYMDVVA